MKPSGDIYLWSADLFRAQNHGFGLFVRSVEAALGCGKFDECLFTGDRAKSVVLRPRTPALNVPCPIRRLIASNSASVSLLSANKRSRGRSLRATIKYHLTFAYLWCSFVVQLLAHNNV